eukprot:scaffold161880_cov28-Tisochrysis_lutea.AAC.4
MLKADKEYFAVHGEPLFSSHMLDLSEEPDEENIAICAKYFKEMAPLKLILEMEIGITGGELHYPSTALEWRRGISGNIRGSAGLVAN